MKPEIIRATEHAMREMPEKAKGSPMVKARSNGSAADLEAGSFRWQTDLPPPLGGGNQAPGPVVFLLGALAGCAAVFIRDTLAPQLGVEVEEVEATAQCRSDVRGLLGIDGIKADLDDLRIDIAIRSSEPEERVRFLYDTWLARCPVFLALAKPMPVTATLSRLADPDQPAAASGPGGAFVHPFARSVAS